MALPYEYEGSPAQCDTAGSVEKVLIISLTRKILD